MLQCNASDTVYYQQDAMIACKLAAMAPEGMPLGLLNVTGGGYECILYESLDNFFLLEARGKLGCYEL